MATLSEQLGEVLRAVGSIEANVTGLRRDLDDMRDQSVTERDKASEGRSRLYKRVEELGQHVAELEKDVRLTATTAAQARDASSHVAQQQNQLDVKLDTHIKRMIPVMRKVRRLEWRIGLFLAGLTALGGGIWWVITSNLNALWETLKKLWA